MSNASCQLLTDIMPYPRSHIDLPFADLLGGAASAFFHSDVRAPLEFASSLQAYLQSPQVLLTASGREAFRLLLTGVDWPQGSEIMFPAYNYHPMPVVAAEFGMRPVFVDVEAGTWNIDPAQVEDRIGAKTRAIVLTHFLGVPADLDALREVADRNGIMLIEDCAHALGSTYKNRPVGSRGAAGIFTFAMSKNMPCLGGGALTVGERAWAEELQELLMTVPRVSGGEVWRRQGGNILAMAAASRLLFPISLYPLLRLADAFHSPVFDRKFIEPVTPPRGEIPPPARPISLLQAQVGCRQLRRFPQKLSRHLGNARRLRRALREAEKLQLQEEPENCTSSFLSIRVRVEDPLRFRLFLRRQGIDTKPDEMRNCAALEIFDDHPGCPNAQYLAGHCIEIPCSHIYSEGEIDDIAARVMRVAREI